MTAFVAFLRAVNVGGTGKLPMRDLKRVCEEAGFSNVRTHGVSGNAIFESAATEAQVAEWPCSLPNNFLTWTGHRALLAEATATLAAAERRVAGFDALFMAQCIPETDTTKHTARSCLVDTLTGYNSLVASSRGRIMSIRRPFILLLVLAGLYFLYTWWNRPVFDSDQISSIRESIKTKFSEREGVTVSRVEMIKEDDHHLSGFVDLSLDGVSLTKSCTATMNDDGQTLWRCQ